jgi:hypothetical protein
VKAEEEALNHHSWEIFTFFIGEEVRLKTPSICAMMQLDEIKKLNLI